jgi:hypothetical protein
MFINEKTWQYIRQHADGDVRKLALQGVKETEVDLQVALQQIVGRQTARKKLPLWAANDDIIYPPHLNMEQCSSEQTARYKASLTPNPSPKGEGDGVFVDLTGGFGVDFYWMSQGFKERIYVEQNEQLCSISTENFRTLGLACSVCCCDTATYLTQLDHADVIYLDPARRDEHGGRTYDIADCSPNVMELLPVLMQKADRVILKLSPMLDWRKAASALQHVAEVHIVSVDNECKELLLVLESAVRPLRLVCVNNGHIFEVPSSNPKHPTPFTHHPTHLYEPNASIMKAGCFDALEERYAVRQVSVNSHLFLSVDEIDDFPGRSFEILAISSMNKRELKDALTGVGKANIAVRNFPLTVDQLRKKLKLKDGGDVYIFATTEADGAHSLFICRKIG